VGKTKFDVHRNKFRINLFLESTFFQNKNQRFFIPLQVGIEPTT
jgi:hypothetical protein